jgi:hypothetical protein
MQRTVGNAVVGRMLRGTVQRFGAEEHRNIGDWATNRKYVTLGDKGYSLSYGEMVAMAGDLFPSLDYMTKLANKPGKGPDSQEALDYARYIKINRRKSKDARTTRQTVLDDRDKDFPGEDAKYNKSSYTKETIKAVDAMYYKLAEDNASHFVAPRGKDAGKQGQDRPGSAGESYRSYHEQAIELAREAGKHDATGLPALAAEAFGAHFLTDAVSSGHLRTPRLDIIDHWSKRDTGFMKKFRGYMMTHVSEWILKNTKVGKALGIGVVYSMVDSGIEDSLKGRTELTLGILVALAVHDFDNKRGLSVLSKGKPAVVFGDGHLAEGDTEKIAIAAVKAGVEDVQKAYALGKAGKTFEQIKKELLGGKTQYKAELTLPVLNPKKGDQNMPVWQVETFDELLKDPNMSEALELTILNNVSEIEDIAKSKSEPAKSGIQHGFADMVRANPIQALKGIHSYVEVPNLDIRNKPGGRGGIDIPTH